MSGVGFNQLATRYRQDGFVSPLRLLDADQTMHHRQAMEDAEARIGPVHYMTKIHTLLRSAWQMATLATGA